MVIVTRWKIILREIANTSKRYYINNDLYQDDKKVTIQIPMGPFVSMKPQLKPKLCVIM